MIDLRHSGSLSEVHESRPQLLRGGNNGIEINANDLMIGFEDGAVGIDGRNSPIPLMLAEQACCIKPHHLCMVLIDMRHSACGKLGKSGGDGMRQEDVLRIECFYAAKTSHAMGQFGVQLPEGKIRKIQIHTRIRMTSDVALGNRFAGNRPELSQYGDARSGQHVRAVREAAPSARIIGFGPHVDDEGANAARADGADVVLPRSRFFRDPSAALLDA